MSEKRKRFDLNSPEAKAQRDAIVHGSFLSEGTMVAFPTCFPGTTVPLAADESRITAVGLAADGMVYAGTSGRRCHLLVGMFHCVTGMVMDLGVVDGADGCVAVGCGKTRYAACVNGSGGGRVIVSDRQPMPSQLIQEWGFTRPALKDLGCPAPGERIIHAVMDASASLLVGATERHVFIADLDAGRLEVVGQVQHGSRLCLGSGSGIFGLDEGGWLWRLDPVKRLLQRQVVKLPSADCGPGLRWAQGAPALPFGAASSVPSHLADQAGRIFVFRENGGFSECLGQAPLTPVGPMAATLDGRVFGFCGEGMARMFCLDPAADDRVRDLGVAVSVIQRRRYGYSFGDAVTGRDGQLFLGEDDDLGHLWMYFPKIGPTSTGSKR